MEKGNKRPLDEATVKAITEEVGQLVSEVAAETGRDLSDPEWDIFRDKATLALKDSVMRGRRLDQDSPSHPEGLYFAGNAWRAQRDTQGISIKDIIARSRFHWSDIVLWERGLIDVRDREASFLDDLAAGYGRPGLARTHRIVFGPIEDTQ